MALVDDLKMPMDEGEETRREFLALVGTGAMALAGLGTAITGVRFMWPEVLFEEERRFRIGTPDEIPVGTLVSLPQQKVYIMHAADGFFAMSATCTHLGCLTQYEKENNRIFCPCHGSRFNTVGEVTDGPAPKPLPRLELALENGLLVVDVSKTVAPDALLKV
jgi:cytochrome b6-f complex iron-sulfur subunit